MTYSNELNIQSTSAIYLGKDQGFSIKTIYHGQDEINDIFQNILGNKYQSDEMNSQKLLREENLKNIVFIGSCL